jgi:hypothetical protein
VSEVKAPDVTLVQPVWSDPDIRAVREPPLQIGSIGVSEVKAPDVTLVRPVWSDPDIRAVREPPLRVGVIAEVWRGLTY